MELTEYARMDAVEDHMWWYRALHRRLVAALTGLDGYVLDAGCGTGGLLARLLVERPDLHAVGLEWAERASRRAADKSGAPVVRGSVNTLPFAAACFDAVIAADLLCHGAVDPAQALAELLRVLRPGGRLIVNMPAYSWLLSDHDRLVHNVRRCTVGQLRALIQGAGFYPRGGDLLERSAAAAHGGAAQAAAPQRSRLRRCPVSAMARCHVSCHHRDGTSPTSLPAGRRVGAGDCGAAMNDDADLRYHLSAAPPVSVGVGLSIVIPVYRGASTIERLVETLSALHPAGGLEIVLVNDGSPDNSGEVCQHLVQHTQIPLTYVEHARNFGEHNAVMTGLRHASGTYVITMDDDLQNPPEEVMRLYDHARLGNWDVVYTRYASKQHAGWRNLGSRFANAVADRLLDKPKGLYLSSFRCMSAFVVQAVTRYQGPYPYVDGLIMQMTQRIDSIEVRHLPRIEGRSNYNLARLVRLWLNLATSFSLAPLRLAVYAGVFMALLGAAGAVATIFEALFLHDTPSGWASTMTVILLVAGVQSMILGVLGEYVGRTFLSANGKPQGAVRSIERSAAAARSEV